ncbi:MAG: hypothetical protein AVDCRST_MAG26-1579, partial [uncultured Chloroflexia bacterium]
AIGTSSTPPRNCFRKLRAPAPTTLVHYLCSF